MENQIEKVRRLVAGAPLGKIIVVNRLGSGYASDAYKLVSSNGEFVVLTEKADGIAPADYAYHFAILKALEAIGYHFAPQAIHIDPEHRAIVMSLCPGRGLSWINHAPEALQKKTVETLVTALLDLRAVSFGHCEEMYKQLTGKPLPITTFKKNVHKYMTGWFEIAQAGKPDEALTKWVQPRIKLCEAYADKTKPGRRITFIHGDTSEGNVLLTPELELHLIDWDTSGFDQFPDGWDDFGIAYLMNHVQLFQKFRPLVIALVSERCSIDADELERRIIQQQENIKLGDIMWAYMMHARAVVGEIKDKPDKFMKIAQQRISDYEKTFARTSFLI